MNLMEIEDVEDLEIEHFDIHDGEQYYFSFKDKNGEETELCHFWMPRDQAISMAKEILRVLDGQE